MSAQPKNPAEFGRIRQSHEAIQASPCPQCGAAPGKRCTAPSGRPATLPHQPRRLAAMASGHWKPGGGSS